MAPAKRGRGKCAGCGWAGSTSVPGLIFIGLSIVDALFLIAIAVTVSVESRDSTEFQNASLYGGVAVYCGLAFALFSLDGVFAENRFQLLATVIVSLCLTGMVGFFAAQTLQHQFTGFWANYSWVCLGIQGLFQILILAMAKPTLDDFGMFAYKVASADVTMHRLFENFRVFVSLLKFDVFVNLLLVILAGFFFEGHYSLSLIETMAAFGVTLVWTAMGWISAVNEYRYLFALFLIGAIVEPTYIVYQLVVIWGDHKQRELSDSQYTAFGGIAVLVRMFLTFYGVKVRQGFNSGLRERVFSTPQRARKLQAVSDGTGYSSMA